MGRGARPPAAFGDRRLTIKVEPAGAVWRRIYRSVHTNPLGYRLARSRFSDPTGHAFGGSTAKVAFVEAILRDQGEGLVHPVPIPYVELEAFVRAEIEIGQELRLLDLCGDGGLRMSVPSDVVGAKNQTLARLWSKAFHEHPTQRGLMGFCIRLDSTNSGTLPCTLALCRSLRRESRQLSSIAGTTSRRSFETSILRSSDSKCSRPDSAVPWIELANRCRRRRKHGLGSHRARPAGPLEEPTAGRFPRPQSLDTLMVDASSFEA